MIAKRFHLVLLIATVFSLCLSGWGATCSNATIKGSYGYSVTGVASDGSAIASVGHFKADGKGSFVGTQTTSSGGQISSNVPTMGTYSINSDCTGSGTITINNKQSNFGMVVVSGGKAFQILSTDSPNVQGGTATAQGNATCTLAGLKGTFGILSSGLFVGIGPVVLSGQFTLDGAGNLKGTESGSIAGQIFNGAPVTGSYKVKSSCTGSATFKIPQQPTEHANLVVVNGGQNLLVIETDTNTVVSGSGQQ